MHYENSEQSSQYCKNKCGSLVEESKMATHLHECPNQPKNSVLELVMSKDLNEVYIQEPQWPGDMPKTRQVFERIRELGYEPPFELAYEEKEDWINVGHRVKKTKVEHRKDAGRR